jgi:putative Ca2+/H+ antiporter (TMEM165/GDT1 family)
MEAFLASLSAVALAEIGDRTQLLLLTLAARHRRPGPILAAMLVGTLASSVLAASIGERLGSALNPRVVNLLVGVSLIAMALWALKPEAAPEAGLSRPSRGLFWSTLVSFLIAEMGDKTQLATAVLAAAYHNVAAVVAGSSLGIALACVPAVLIGQALSARLPLRAIRVVSSLLFLGLGVLFLVRAARGTP